MKTFLKIITLLLLLFNSIGAIYGGGNLILHPDGSSIQLPVDLLRHSPFQDYFIPGIILLIVNGLFSIFVLATVIFNRRNHTTLIIAQGIILTLWIIIQIIYIRSVYSLHIILGTAGLALIVLGILQQKYSHSKLTS